jgi:effector-binding domain-containing protein
MLHYLPFIQKVESVRYYSAQQLTELNRILVLKELGLSLEQIAHLLEQNTSTDEMRGMLMLRKAQIEQTVQEEMSRLRMIESRLEQINAHGEIREPDIVLKSIEAQNFLAHREIFPNMYAVQKFVSEISNFVPTRISENSLGHIVVVIHTPIYEPEKFDLEIGFVFTGKGPDRVQLLHEKTLTVRELPAVETMATVIHVGSVEQRHRGYATLATWLEHNGYQITGLGRETLMQLPLKPSDDAVMELQLPVTKLKQKLGA